MRKRLPLEEGEKIEFRSAGALSVAASGRWRLGEWIKTDKRLLFVQAGGVNFEAALDLLNDVSQCEREYSFGIRPCLKIVWDSRPFWLTSRDVKAWQDRLSRHLRGFKMAGEPFCDVIDEGDFYRVVIEAPFGVEVAMEDYRLQVADKKGFRRVIRLPPDSAGFLGDKFYRNGILEVHVGKKTRSISSDAAGPS